MQALLAVSRVIDAINSRLGKWLSWALLAAVLISAGNAVVRKSFDMSSNTWLELQWILFSVVFLLCSPWTLLRNEHIRIDIINNMLPKPARNWIELLGHLFFLLFIQAISEIIKRIAVMRGMIDDPHASVHHPAEAEVEELIQAIKSAEEKAVSKP